MLRTHEKLPPAQYPCVAKPLVTPPTKFQPCVDAALATEVLSGVMTLLKAHSFSDGVRFSSGVAMQPPKLPEASRVGSWYSVMKTLPAVMPLAPKTVSSAAYRPGSAARSFATFVVKVVSFWQRSGARQRVTMSPKPASLAPTVTMTASAGRPAAVMSVAMRSTCGGRSGGGNGGEKPPPPQPPGRAAVVPAPGEG